MLEKIRIWNEKYKCYEFFSIGCDFVNLLPESEVYIGIKDTFGKEIYENDVAKVIFLGKKTYHLIKYLSNYDYPAFDLRPTLKCDYNGISFIKNEPGATIQVIGHINNRWAMKLIGKEGV